MTFKDEEVVNTNRGVRAKVLGTVVDNGTEMCFVRFEGSNNTAWLMAAELSSVTTD